LNGSVSDDGTRVSFDSLGDNLVAGDTNGQPDVFVRDRRQATTTRVSVSTSNVQGNEGSVASAISGDGRFVSFTSGASNLVPMDTNGAADIFVHRNP
jgi:Tol biopolymer transport system component